ncbi:MAG TPA: hypothetical protein PLK58_10520 [Candidatus Rifleibacterium sp.]|jgi:hypothetical protein|nr:hypothetical protein [Candidatus Rifleibacterium sp.]
MQTEYGKNTDISSSGFPGVFEVVAVAGFLTVVASTFLNFTPVVAQTWRAGGIGLPVMLACVAGAVFMLFRNYFAGFFIAVFSGFFLTHEIIIIYDNKAVELGRELGSEGWFRLVFDVYRDAFAFNTGAFWALVGVLLAMTGVCVGWVLNIVRLNNEAVQLSLLAAGADKSTAEAESAEMEAQEDESDWSDADESVDEDDQKSEDEHQDSEEEYQDSEDDTRA